MEKSAVEFLLEKYKSQNTLLFAEDWQQAKEIEKEQKEHLLNYIKDVRDVCGKHYNPTETELHYLSIRAENISATFKSK